ncbi:MAG: hypothetical protein IT290_05030 [Deltaproteobacteria bacterium]|nr:hypothetical protein [Deltaproteobacteria bacterium]
MEEPDSPPRDKGTSSFLESASSRFGLGEVWTRLSSKEALTIREATALPRAPLSLLFRFASTRTTSTSTVTVRPLIYLPLAEWIERSGAAAASSRAVKACEAASASAEIPNFFFAIDRWSGNFRLDMLLDVIATVVSVRGGDLPVTPIGPTSSDLATLRDAQSADGTPEVLASILRQFKSYGVQAIDGGTNVELHEFAALRGFHCALGHDVSELVESAIHDPAARDLDTESFSQAYEERFVLELLDARERIGGTGKLAAWFPWYRSALRQYHPTTDQALATPLFRILMLARLILGERTSIRAPVGLVGRNLALVASTLGIRDLGYAALNLETSESLGVVRLSELKTLGFPMLTVHTATQFGEERAT